MERSTQFLESTVRLLVVEKDAVKVTRTIDDIGVLLTLNVAPADMGLVLGRLGQTALALRTLLRTIGFADKESVHMKISDPRRKDNQTGTRA
jgi:predicted RNA-binding protein YlqC (UPF0109 family)